MYCIVEKSVNMCRKSNKKIYYSFNSIFRSPFHFSPLSIPMCPPSPLACPLVLVYGVVSTRGPSLEFFHVRFCTWACMYVVQDALALGPGAAPTVIGPTNICCQSLCLLLCTVQDIHTCMYNQARM